MSVDLYRFHNKPDKQITYGLEMEQRLAVAWSGYSWKEYKQLATCHRWLDPASGGDTQANVLASYRMYKRMEAISGDYKRK